jgi:hypothetical protein
VPGTACEEGCFIPHIRPRTRSDTRESWSEWQDLNLRPLVPNAGNSEQVTDYSDVGCATHRVLFMAAQRPISLRYRCAFPYGSRDAFHCSLVTLGRSSITATSTGPPMPLGACTNAVVLDVASIRSMAT